MSKITKKVRLGVYGAILFIMGVIGSSNFLGAVKDKVVSGQDITGGDFVAKAYADHLSPSPITDPGPAPCPSPSPSPSPAGPGCCE